MKKETVFNVKKLYSSFLSFLKTAGQIRVLAFINKNMKDKNINKNMKADKSRMVL